MLNTRAWLAAVVTVGMVTLLSATPASAITIPIAFNQQAIAGSPSFYTVSQGFTLPSDFTNASLFINAISCDDRCVVQLNGTTITNAGIFGPGAGSMTLTLGGPNNPFTFTFGNGAQNLLVTSGFGTGLNTLLFILNDTNQGIFGSPLAGGVNISSMSFAGTVTYDVPTSAVPEPGSTLTFLGLGFLAMAERRRRQTR